MLRSPRRLFEKSWPPMTTFQRIEKTWSSRMNEAAPARMFWTRAFIWLPSSTTISSRMNGISEPMISCIEMKLKESRWSAAGG